MNLDVVIPFFNEEGCAESLIRDLTAALDSMERLSIRFFLVDDGSTDRTPDILARLASEDGRIRVVPLWGNHGHQRALVAGLDCCGGDAVLMMDGDGQHPAETAAELVRRALAEPSRDIVQAVRNGSQGGTGKDLGSSCFYWIANRVLPGTAVRPGASDFRLLRRPVVDLVRQYPDRHRNLRVLLASLKLPTVYVDYEVRKRLSGRSKYRFRHMVELATNGIFAFSSLPLRFSLLLMLFTGAIGASYLLYVLVMFGLGRTVPGWTSLIWFVAFLFCGVFGILAVLSEYVARIYEDVRRHPVYRLRPNPHGFSDATTALTDTEAHANPRFEQVEDKLTVHGPESINMII